MDTISTPAAIALVSFLTTLCLGSPIYAQRADYSPMKINCIMSGTWSKTFWDFHTDRVKFEFFSLDLEADVHICKY